jgi:2-C-methyl-D-erythritol 2,4-cyclodiphosphate synthase
MYRIGIGYDIHRLAEERKLFIGGVEIPYIKGLVGHSDADVLLHALSDALLGAVGAGDVGEHFPDTDPQYQNISSTELLKKAAGLVKDKGFKIHNLDTVVIAQEPNLAAFKSKIQQKLAQILGVSPERINIKAKTNNGLGDIGAVDAIASFAVVSLVGEEVKC